MSFKTNRMLNRNISKKCRKTWSKKGGESGKTPVDDCSICTEPMDNIDNLITTDCNHTFHKDCLRRWCRAQAKNECPLCRKNIANICSSLIEQYIDSATRVFNAIENNNLNEVKDIIETEIQNVGATDSDVRNKQLVDFFYPANVDSNTFLMSAARVGNAPIVKYLLDLVNEGLIPKHLEARHTMMNRIQYYEVNYVNIINEEDNVQSALHIAIDKNNMDIVNMLLDNPSIDMNVMDTDGFTPVIYAINNNNLELVKKLVDKGARLYNQLDSFPLALAQSLSPRVNDKVFKYMLTLSPEKLGRTEHDFMQHANWMLRAYVSDKDTSQPRLEILQQYIDNKQLRTTGGKLRSTKKRRTIRKKNKKPTRKARK